MPEKSASPRTCSTEICLLGFLPDADLESSLSSASRLNASGCSRRKSGCEPWANQWQEEHCSQENSDSFGCSHNRLCANCIARSSLPTPLLPLNNRPCGGRLRNSRKRSQSFSCQGYILFISK